MKKIYFLLSVCFLVGTLGCLNRPPVDLKGMTIVVGEDVPGSIQGAAQFCEGPYQCLTGGSIYKIGDTSNIGFWNVATCPPNTTLNDGSSWQLKPGCNCP